MKVNALTSLLSHLPQLAGLVRDSAGTRVYGLLQCARPAVVASVHAQMRRPLLVVTHDPQGAVDFYNELGHWTGARCALFPAIETLPYERVHLDRVVLAEREAVARGIADCSMDIVIASARALLQPVQRPRSAQGGAITLRLGDAVSLDHILTSWIEGGYAEVSMVDEPGTFGRRGGVVDVFPAGAQFPVRVELFGNEIDSLRVFDPVSQRSLERADQVTVEPIAVVDEDARLLALESLMDLDTAGMNADARTRWLDDLAALEAGASLDELAVFAPYLMGDVVSLLECLPAPCSVLIDGADETYAVLEDLWRQAGEVQQSLVDSGNLPGGLKPAMVSPQSLQQRLAGVRYIELRAGSAPDPEDIDLTGVFSQAPRYTGRLRNFVRDVAARSGLRTVIASNQYERVGELLAEEGIEARHVADLEAPPEPGVTLVQTSLAEGWSLPDAQLLLLTDYELFGRARSRPVPRRPRAPRQVFFSDFAPGDYVVHLEHGIGRFQGVTRMTIDGVEREYALVQYAGTDRLYVPSDQLERLTRYIGVGDTPPPLNKLGGAEWQRSRARAKQAAAEIARELIDLYAKRTSRPGHGFAPDSPWQHELESSFPYPETPDQLRAVDDVKHDMEEPHPMDRLVCADVGYGKTEVAIRAAFKAVMDGKQVAVLVPTTILAQQHFETFAERTAAFPITVEVLSRFRKPAEQRDILRRLASGEIDILIGTHRMLGKDVSFKNLGLLVIDEEQRFGVRHKEQLKRLRETVDVLTLTATPIPRTLHMGLVGIREISVIETPPEGRLPIKTFLQPFDDRLVREAVLRELDRGGQVYIVHNRVATIEAMAEKIRSLVPEARVVVGHGQMDETQLERVMLAFAHREADVLLCSTIIENGLDIPNVNTIIVNGAQRLGLTQLYQLRGRVGRSANQAYAYLLYPRDVRLTHDAMQRMEAVFEAQDLGAGFTIAMRDLEIRGAGNLLGAEQSGNATAIGFDLYTRMIADAVEQLRGVPLEEQPMVTLDLPLTMFLPKEYVGNEAERLNLYRRLAGVSAFEDLDALTDEIVDRFGAMPVEVLNLVTSVQIKLMAMAAHVTSVTLSGDNLILRTDPSGVYDRVFLYKRYGSQAKISTNVLRIPRSLLRTDWEEEIRDVLQHMIELRTTLRRPQPVGA